MSLKLAIALTLGLLFYCVSAAVIGIDLGTEFIKIGIVKPGSPVDAVLNEQSKRKTPAMVGWRNTERHVGESAKTLSTRFPITMFKNLNFLIGKQYNKSSETFKRVFENFHSAAKVLRNRDRNGTIDLVVDDNTRYSTEELMAMILQYVKKLATDNAGSPVVDCVINIPPFYGIAERQAVLDAAQLAGFNVLSLLHETTALALQYGFTKYRTIKENHEAQNKTIPKHNVMVIDIGAGSSKIVIAELKPINKKDTLDMGILQVKGLAWDKDVSGIGFDSKIVDFIAREYKKQYNIDVQLGGTNARSTARLYEQAKKIKELLTPNEKISYRVEGIVEDKDMSVDFSREQFTEISKDLLQKLGQTIARALKDANITVADLDGIELVGGASRIPIVQQAIVAHLGRGVGYSLNGDEAIAIGSSYFAASQSSYFRVRSFQINDVYPYQIEFSISNLAKQQEEKPSEEKLYSLIKHNDKFDAVRSINVPKTEDFVIAFKYNYKYIPDDTSRDIARFEITGVKEVMDNFTATSKDGKSKVKITFLLTNSGILKLDTAEAKLEYMENVLVPDVEEKADDTSKPATAEKKEPKTKKEKKVIRKDLKSRQINDFVLPLSKEQREKSKQRLKELDEIDYYRTQVSKARNDLEGYLYSVRDLLLEPSGSEDYTPFYTKKDLEAIKTTHASVEEWFGSTASDLEDKLHPSKLIEEYQKQLQSLKTLCEPIYSRFQEKSERDRVFKFCNNVFNNTRTMLTTLQGAMNWLTDGDFAEYNILISETVDWVNQKQKKQEAIPLYENPIVVAADVEARCKRLNTSVLRAIEVLAKKPKPEPKTAKPAAENTTIEAEKPKTEEKKEEPATAKPKEEL